MTLVQICLENHYMLFASQETSLTTFMFETLAVSCMRNLDFKVEQK